jgi:hypothetical protein
MATEMSSPSMFLARLEVEHDRSHRFGGKFRGRCSERWGFELENATGQPQLVVDHVRLKWKLYLGWVPASPQRLGPAAVVLRAQVPPGLDVVVVERGSSRGRRPVTCMGSTGMR